MKESIRLILEKVKTGVLSVDEGTTILDSMISSSGGGSSPGDSGNSFASFAPPAPARPGAGNEMEDLLKQAGLDSGSSQEMASEIDRILKDALGKLQR